MFATPSGMTRRHFLSHLAGASAMTIPALTLGHSLRTHAAELKKNHKAAILLWMSGGPSMSTREADHMRGRYYMHTGYVPNPNIEHPSYGAVVAHELYKEDSGLQI